MYRPIVFVVVAGLMVGCSTDGKINNSDSERTKNGEAAMVTMFASRTLSVSIGRHPREVYEFASNPENLPKWAKGTLFRLPDMSDEKYTEDMKLVEQDLRALKDLLEK